MKVYVGGTFDLFHNGHVNFLRAASTLGKVTVSLNTDDFAARYKRRPVMTLAERNVVVMACRYVDAIVVNTGHEDSRPAILKVGPDVIAHGNDWLDAGLKRQMGLTDEWLTEQKIRLIYLKYTAGVSTSELIARCRDRDVSREARELVPAVASSPR